MCETCGAMCSTVPPPAELEEALVAGGVELQDRPAELEALRPLGPALAVYRPWTVKTGEPFGRVPRLAQAGDLRTRDRPEGGERLPQVLERDGPSR